MKWLILLCALAWSADATFSTTSDHSTLTELLSFNTNCYINTECGSITANTLDGYTSAEQCYNRWPMFDYAKSLCGGNNFHSVQTFCESFVDWPGDRYILTDNELYSDGKLYRGCYLPDESSLTWTTTLEGGFYTSVASGPREFICQTLLAPSSFFVPSNTTEPYGRFTRAVFHVNETTTDCITAEMVTLRSQLASATALVTDQTDYDASAIVYITTMGTGIVLFLFSIGICIKHAKR